MNLVLTLIFFALHYARCVNSSDFEHFWHEMRAEVLKTKGKWNRR
jgi:hypothetical protein